MACFDSKNDRRVLIKNQKNNEQLHEYPTIRIFKLKRIILNTNRTNNTPGCVYFEYIVFCIFDCILIISNDFK